MEFSQASHALSVHETNLNVPGIYFRHGGPPTKEVRSPVGCVKHGANGAEFSRAAGAHRQQPVDNLRRKVTGKPKSKHLDTRPHNCNTQTGYGPGGNRTFAMRPNEERQASLHSTHRHHTREALSLRIYQDNDQKASVTTPP